MDFPYLAGVTRLNLATAAALARAPAPPEVTVEGAVKPDTTVTWLTRGPLLVEERLYHRRTDEASWRALGSKYLQGKAKVEELKLKGHSTQHPDGTRIVSDSVERAAASRVLPGLRIDDWVFGVSSVSADGYESPVASAVPGGAWEPLPAPTPPAQ